jgi:predicted kinase
MRKLRLTLITGLPGTGKTTLARELARRFCIALIAKDTIKEALLDVLGTTGARSCDEPPARERSRELSDASFASMLAIAAELLASGVDLILEANFRTPEHTAKVLSVLPARTLKIVQVLCRLGEPERLARLTARPSDSARHRGHALAPQLERVPACDGFLELPGTRLLFDGRASEADMSELMASLEAAWSAD